MTDFYFFTNYFLLLFYTKRSLLYKELANSEHPLFQLKFLTLLDCFLLIFTSKEQPLTRKFHELNFIEYKPILYKTIHNHDSKHVHP